MGPAPGAAPEEGYDLTARAERLAAYPLAAQSGPVIFAGADEGFELGLRAVVVGVGGVLRGGAGHQDE
ncbi:hypothetical protein OG897_24770 [Streptomyces sp. NBC_00237]|uniref:hypothetical protein n=1 Tax=Streptomyces sp. NBC_00237 TaxID=2975687 RepID=UPI002251DD7F|nr:hypothetical protein [Streptomyces sp. NBC_00237]MCX5204656.1 hypothetical protein [Streptomyces sp. NBC_00237]